MFGIINGGPGQKGVRKGLPNASKKALEHSSQTSSTWVSRKSENSFAIGTRVKKGVESRWH
jgi:hypothetical protein